MSESSTSVKTLISNQENCSSPFPPWSVSLSHDNFMKAKLKLNGEEIKGKIFLFLLRNAVYTFC